MSQLIDQEDATVRILTIGDRLGIFRKSLGKAQIPFAAELGVSQSAYKNYERNYTDMPVSLVVKLCQEYGLSADWLLFGSGRVRAGTAREVMSPSVGDHEQSN